MDKLASIFENFTYRESFQRVDNVHPLDLYVGVDEKMRWTLLLLCDNKPQNVVPSKMLDVKIGKRQDQRWTISFALLEKKYQDMFLLFCKDMIDSSRQISNRNKGSRFLVQRYLEWKEMLANTSDGLLSPEVIKGLLGELYFLYNIMIPKYGIEKAISSWTGILGTDQDFKIDNTWYELKTVSNGKDSVKISSIEQLDSINEGTLAVVFTEKTSSANANSTNINKIYHQLLAIMDDDLKTEFSNKLLRFGYIPRSEYENENNTYQIMGVDYYRVRMDFPCLRKITIPGSVIKAEYVLSLPAIQQYKKDCI